MTTATSLPALPARNLRHADIGDLVAVLQQQQRQSVDLVVPASTLVSRQGNLQITQAPVQLDVNGVLDPNGSYRPTANADAQLGGLFGIPVGYTRKLRANNIDLFDININDWAGHADYADKKVLLRTLWGANPEDPETNGIIRAVVSDRFGGATDNFDTVVSVLDGIREGGLAADQVQIKGDLTDDRMFITVRTPEIHGYAHKLLAGYRSPYGNGQGTGHGGTDAENLPIVEAGLIIKNSETGNGALSITPRLVVRVCSNGLTMTTDAMRRVHLGSKLEEGAIVWSDSTRRAANELAKKQAADAVKSFLSVDYVTSAIAKLEAESDTPVTDVVKTIEVVAKEHRYTEDEAKSVLDFFIDGGQRTAGGVMQAITAAVQQIEDAERAFEVEATAIDAMRTAAKVAVAV